MWPLKNKIYYALYGNVKLDDDGNTLTLIHDKGANRFTKNDVLNYSFESDIFSPSLEDYSMINKFLLFVLFGGFLNMFYSLFPVTVWSYADGRGVRSEIWFNSVSGSLFHSLILIGLAILFSYSVYFLIIYLLKQYRINNRLNKYHKDILTISLNNVQLKVRIEEHNGQEVLLFLGADSENDLIHSSNKFNSTAFPGLNLRHLGILSLIIIPIFLLNCDVPFWFYQLEKLEDIIRNSFLSSRFSNDTILYWKYFGTWDGKGGVINMTNPVKAFFDGTLSNATLPFVVVISLLAILLAIIFISLVFYVLCWPGVLFYCLFCQLLKPESKIIQRWSWLFVVLAFVIGFLGMFTSTLILAVKPIVTEWDVNYGNFYNITGLVFLTITNLFFRRFIEPVNVKKVIKIMDYIG